MKDLETFDKGEVDPRLLIEGDIYGEEAAITQGSNMSIGFFGGLAELANIGGGRDTYTTTSTGGAATVALIVVLGVLLVTLVSVGLGNGKGRR